MSLDEKLFALAWRAAHALRRRAPAVGDATQAARLSELQPHLTLVARALSGVALEVREAEHAGGFRGEVLYLPPHMAFAPTHADNVQAYVYRVAYTVTSRQLGLSLEAHDTPASAYQLFRTLLAVPATLHALEATLPMARPLRTHLFSLLLATRPPWPSSWEHGRLARSGSGQDGRAPRKPPRHPWFEGSALDTTAACLEALTQLLLGRPWPTPVATPGWTWLQHAFSLATAGDHALEAHTLWTALQRNVRPASATPVAPVVLWGQLLPDISSAQTNIPEDAALQHAFPSGTERPGKPKEHVRHVALEQRDIDNDVLIHTFDKIDTAEEFQGLTRTPDGADELAQHAEALDELDLREVIRSTTRTQSIYQANLLLDGNIGDLQDTATPPTATYLYDEWDAKARSYKPRWCTVYVQRPPTPPPEAATAAAALLHKHTRLMRDLRLLLDKVRSQRVLRNRQPDGAEVDLDAMVARYATVRSGHAPDDRLYLTRRRQQRELATLLLLDLSASTDAWIEGARVLDIARESVLVLGEVLEQWHDRMAVAGFYSHTRRDCRFVLLKHFDEPWARCKAALAHLEPTGYTRMGPALRHGTALLQRQSADKKLLLLISDGKPTDYDRYEGHYGMADVRQALREAQQAHVHTYALAVDVQAKLYLPQMFGRGNFQILPHPTHLVRSLADLYRRLSG